MKRRKPAAKAAPKTGDITQLAAILAIVIQFTNPIPAAAIPAPSTPPTMEWVVDTSALMIVAKLIQSAAARRALNMSSRNSVTSSWSPGAMIPLETVLTTSPPASNAPALSQIAAITIAQHTVITFPPTAGPILLATSFAPTFRAT